MTHNHRILRLATVAGVALGIGLICVGFMLPRPVQAQESDACLDVEEFAARLLNAGQKPMGIMTIDNVRDPLFVWRDGGDVLMSYINYGCVDPRGWWIGYYVPSIEPAPVVPVVPVPDAES